MELRSLRYFLAVVDTGSFNAASAAIAISQPALTRQIHDLEKELGVTLLRFCRSKARGRKMIDMRSTAYVASS
jgi:DNA-binding transcriptional LysR family regulator